MVIPTKESVVSALKGFEVPTDKIALILETVCRLYEINVDYPSKIADYSEINETEESIKNKLLMRDELYDIIKQLKS